MITLLSFTAFAFERASLAEALGAPDQDFTPIVNGIPEPAFDQTVALGAAGFVLCTGSVITPRIILSAAHCGGDLPVETIALAGSAYFGENSAAPFHEARFSDAFVHPDYIPLESAVGGTLGKFDLALLVLTEDAPVEPIWFNDSPLDDSVLEQEILSVGYGRTETGSSGTRRSAMLTVDEVRPMFLISRNENNEADANICNGDSGGPQYVFNEDIGRWEQWAVHSWGDQNCQFESGSTRTDRASDWIYEHIEAVHGTTDRCAIMGHYGDGTCDSFCDAFDPDCGPIWTDNADTTGVVTEAPGGCSHTSGAGPAWLLLVGFPWLLRARSRQKDLAERR